MSLETARTFKMQLFDQFSRIGKVLSSPTRLEILDLLCQGERTVESLAKSASQSVANTSKHLQLLRAAQLVSTKRKGNYIYYQLANKNVALFWQSFQELGNTCMLEVQYLVNNFFGKDEEIERLNRTELVELARKNEIIIIDVRPIEEFNNSHIEGAISSPIKDLEDVMSTFGSDKIIVAYCRGPYCVLSHEAVKLLRERGFRAYRLPDSITDWTEAGMPIETKKKEVPQSEGA